MWKTEIIMHRIEDFVLDFQGSHYGNVVWVMFLMNLKIFLLDIAVYYSGIVKTYE